MMTNKDKRQNDNIEKMMESATEKTNDSVIEPSEKKNGSLKVVIFSVIGLIVFLGLLGFGAFMMNNNDDFEDKTNVPDWVGKEKEEEPSNIDDNWDFEHPIELKEWAKKPYNESFWNQEEIEGEILDTSRDLKGFYYGVSWMNSGLEHEYEDKEGLLADPYTNDISKRYLDENSEDENPQFSYALKEDYEKAYVTYTERLLNPIFGNWSIAQISEIGTKSDRQFNVLEDMFTAEWWDKNIENSNDYSRLPIFAEWEEDEWSKYDLSERESMYGIFYGQIIDTHEKSISSEVIGIDNEEQEIVKVISPVKFSAFKKDGDVLEITGTLTLTLKSNEDNLDVINRVVISDAALKIDE